MRGPPGRPREARGPSSSSTSSDHAAAGSGFFGLVLAEALLGDFAGLALGFIFVLVALVFLALARLGGFALGAVGGFAAGAAAGFFLGDLAFFGFAHAANRPAHERARCALPRSVCAARRRRLSALLRRRRGAGAATAGLAAGAGCAARFRRFDGFGFGSGFGRAADDAAFDLLDDDLLAAAVAEALAHHARFRARLQRQRLAGHAEFLSSPGVFVSLIPYLFRFQVRRRRRGVVYRGRFRQKAGPKALKTLRASEKSVAHRAGKQGCMYHI